MYCSIQIILRGKYNLRSLVEKYLSLSWHYKTFIKYGSTFVFNFLLHFSFTMDSFFFLFAVVAFLFSLISVSSFLFISSFPSTSLLSVFSFLSSHLAVLFKHAVNLFIPQRQNQLSEQHFVSIIHLQNAYLWTFELLLFHRANKKHEK